MALSFRWLRSCDRLSILWHRAACTETMAAVTPWKSSSPSALTAEQRFRNVGRALDGSRRYCRAWIDQSGPRRAILRRQDLGVFASDAPGFGTMQAKGNRDEKTSEPKTSAVWLICLEISEKSTPRIPSQGLQGPPERPAFQWHGPEWLPKKNRQTLKLSSQGLQSPTSSKNAPRASSLLGPKMDFQDILG